MHAQRRDLIIATKEVCETENAVLLCADCDNVAAPFSCYCQKCEAELYSFEWEPGKLAATPVEGLTKIVGKSESIPRPS